MSQLALLAIALGLFIAGCLIFAQFLYGAPFVPSHTQAVVSMLTLIEGRDVQNMVDLGSGTGKIVIGFAKEGIEAHGYEINPLLVWISRWRIRRLGLEGRAHIHQGNFWKKDFSQFDVVTMFAMDHMMAKLKKKIQDEMSPGSVILSNAYRFHEWKEDDKVGSVFRYIV